MRRVLVAILAFCYLAVSSGVTLRAHFCMGEAQGTDLMFFSGAAEHTHTCPKCGMRKGVGGNGCCKDEHKVVKLEQKHVPGSDVAIPLFAGFFALPAMLPFGLQISQPLASRRGHYTATCNGPPIRRSSGTPIYLRVRNFRV